MASRVDRDAHGLAMTEGGDAVTGGDRPFQRPSPGLGAELADPSMQVENRVEEGFSAGLPILDPNFHQSVWKPWQDDAAPDVGTPGADPFDATSAPASRSRRPRTAWMALGTVALLLTAALTLPSMLQRDTAERNPIVNDLGMSPSLAWSADYGDTCLLRDPDNVVLSNRSRVWSVDLPTGETVWTSDIRARHFFVTCLPGADVVAVTEATAAGVVIGVTLLSGTTGGRVSGFPGDEVVRVVPLGNDVGLVAPDHTLTLVALDDPSSPLWSTTLPGPEGRLEEWWMETIDDATVKLVYSITNTMGDASPQHYVTLSILTGQPPAWAKDDPTEFQRQRVGDVILSSRGSESSSAGDRGAGESVIATDLLGRELWTQEGASPTVAGSRVLLSTGFTDSQSWERLHEVDPRTGTPVDGSPFEGEFRHVFTTADSRPVLFQGDALTVLDQDMHPQSSIPAENFLFLFQGHEQMYLGRNIDGSGQAKLVTMTAIDTRTSAVAWEFELAWGQSVEQLGRHLVVVDGDGMTMHGFGNSGR